MSNADRRPWKIRVRHALEYVLVRVLICVIQTFSIESCTRMARPFGRLAFDWLRIRRRVTVENLQATFPERGQGQLDEIARKMWEHLFLMICEVAHASRMIHQATWKEYVFLPDRKLLTQYFLDGRPLLMVSGHFGNFEIASYTAGVLGIPTFAMGKPIGNPLIDEFVRRFRSSRGQYLVPYNNSTGMIEKILQDDQVLTLLGDQHAGARGCWVDFFGRPASCHKALALFTLTQNAPMLVNYVARRGSAMQFEIGCEGIADPHELTDQQSSVRGLTQWYNQRLESFVRRHPEQYWWLHKRWKGGQGKCRDKPDRSIE